MPRESPHLSGRTAAASTEPSSLANENPHDRQRFGRMECSGDYRALFDKNPSPTWVFDRQTLVILVANDAALARSPSTNRNVLGLRIMDACDGVDRQCLMAAAAAPGDGTQVVGLLRRENIGVAAAQVEWRDVDFAGRPGRMVVIREYSPQDQAETSHAETNKRKDDFLAVLAHELRNPLAPIRNALQILKQPGVGSPTADRLRQMMERQVVHLSRLVDDLVLVSRLNQGRIVLRKEVVSAAVLLGRAAEAMQPRFEERRQALDVCAASDLWLEVDLTRLEQVLLNLLHNAAKYTDPGGQVWLTAERAGDEAVIHIKDAGIGIAPAMLPFIFEPLVQLERRLDHSVGGVGVGLTIVRKLVELHGGTVAAFSAGADQGAEFVIRLPCLPAEH